MKTFFANRETDWNELVFEHRNKIYGAYVLRSEYDVTVLKSYLFTLGGLLIFSLSFLLFRGTKPPIPIPKDPTIVTTIFKIPDDVKKIPDVQQKPPVKPEPKRKDVIPTVIDTLDNDKKTKPDDKKTLEPSIPVDTGTGTTQGSDPNTGSNQGSQGSGGSSAGSSPGTATTYADVPPEFPGGDEALYEFIRSRVNFYRAKNAGIESAKIMVSFIIDPEGNVTDIEPISTNGFGMEEDVMLVLKKMPRWTPGKIQNTNVYVRFYLPVQYQTE